MQMKFDALPKSGREIEPGPQNLYISDAKSSVSSTGSTMFVLEIRKDKASRFSFNEYMVVFDANKQPIPFGQYKLRCLLVATNTIPDGEVSTEVIAALLIGKTFKANIVEQNDNGRMRIRLGAPESFQPAENVAAEQAHETETPASDFNLDAFMAGTAATTEEEDLVLDPNKDI